MAAMVRVINGRILGEHAQKYGSQVALALTCGLSPQRMSQLITGAGPVIRAAFAVRIEDELGVRRGDLFTADEPQLIRHYVGGLLDHDDGDGEPIGLEPPVADPQP